MKRALELLDQMGRIPRVRLFLLMLGLTLTVGAMDYWTGECYSISVLYFPVIALTCWLLGLRIAVGLSLLASVLWILDDFLIPPTPLPDFFKYMTTLARFAVLAAFAYLLEQLRKALHREYELSHFDKLTGLANRMSLFDDGQRDLARCRRSGRPVTAVYIDLDEFKQVNDRYGHAEGDHVLRVVAECLRANTRDSDMTARIGGDEFVVLAPEMTFDAAQRFTKRLHNCLKETMAQHGWPVTFSMGAATFNSPPPRLDDIVKVADDLMYVVKRREKDAIKHSLVDGAVGPRTDTTAADFTAV